MNPEDEKPLPGSEALPDSTRREFCKKSGLLVLGTAAYTVISILAAPQEAQAGRCGCVIGCNCACTSYKTPACSVRG